MRRVVGVALVVVAVLLCGGLRGQAAPLNVLPLGDSITFGTGAEEQGGYRGPLDARLKAVGADSMMVGRYDDPAEADFDAAHVGVPAMRIPQVYGREFALRYDDGDPSTPPLQRWLPTLEEAGQAPEAVLMHMGTNDLHGQAGDVEAAISAMDGLLDWLRIDHQSVQPGLAEEAAVFVAQILPRTRGGSGGFSQTTIQQTAAFNDGLSTLVDDWRNDPDADRRTFGQRLHLVNMAEIELAGLPLDPASIGLSAADVDVDGDGYVDWVVEEADAAYVNTALIHEWNTDGSFDGIHPTQAGYQIMAAQWHRALHEAGLVAIPEPTSWVWLLGAGAWLMWRRVS